MSSGCLAQSSSQKLVVTAGMWYLIRITTRPGETDKSPFSRGLLELLGPTVNFISAINSNFLPWPTRFYITYLHTQCSLSSLKILHRSVHSLPLVKVNQLGLLSVVPIGQGLSYLRSLAHAVSCHSMWLTPSRHWNQLSCPVSGCPWRRGGSPSTWTFLP